MTEQYRLSRRTLLTRGLVMAAATSGAYNLRPAWAASSQIHKFKCGTFDMTVISDGLMSFSLAFALPDRDPKEVEAVFKAAGLPTDGVNAQVNVAIIKTADALILIDTGGGTDFVPTVGKLADRLEAAGITPEAFTHVIFTHAHADHLWGVLDPFEGGTRFINAKHIITAVEFDFWSKPGLEADVADMFKTMVIGSARRLKTIAEKTEFRKAGEEIVPGVTLVDTAGHTPGHVSVMVESSGQKLLVVGDALNNPLVSFTNPYWRWRSDMDSDTAVATRKRLLDQLATDKIGLLGYHLPWPGIGRVERANNAFRFVQG